MNDRKISSPTLKWITAAILSAAIFTGCSKSKQDQAIEQAKQQATATGQPQQVISVDKDGNTVTTVVQPPQPGQTGQQVTTTVTPKSNLPTNAPAVAGGQAATAPAPGYAGDNSAPVGQSTPTTTPTPGNPVIAPADVRIPAGTTLAIRINQHLSVKTNRAGDHFDGEIAETVVGDNGQLIVPRGTPVGGVVAASHKRGHFKGASILQLRLTSMTLNGTSYPIRTSSLTRTKKGKGKRSAAFIGGGSGLGMLIGGLATGGTGLLIGGLAGAGAGTAAAGLTGNADIDIPSESLIHFKLANTLTLQPS
ncbi:hypothetical protein [Edaphobacter albus]|uniref:hypothetical protein n=1 Tax=Edaphobacter sp. 4G125 TaxID=2763071 RepID=UPI001648A4B3|nr:hypothetical protein [Edaphobacter sp. 4G125]QNI36680.1 hypothetical protein H7846_17345 [Edaphobacter sp. 4G125]